MISDLCLSVRKVDQHSLNKCFVLSVRCSLRTIILVPFETVIIIEGINFNFEIDPWLMNTL